MVLEQDTALAQDGVQAAIQLATDLGSTLPVRTAPIIDLLGAMV